MNTVPTKCCTRCRQDTDAFELSENGGICDECADDESMEDQSWGAHEDF
jgi:hypothetical protein